VQSLNQKRVQSLNQRRVQGVNHTRGRHPSPGGRGRGAGRQACPSGTAGARRPAERDQTTVFRFLDLYRRSPESGGLWHIAR
jgi:hypothetical protein